MKQVVVILRVLWDRRRLVMVAAFVALTVGFLFAYRPGFPPESRHYTVGLAATDVLVDTPNSQVVALDDAEDTQGGGELAGRASLLANLIAANPLRAQIAARAGISPRKLATVPPTTSVGTPALATAPVSPPADKTANVLILRVDSTLPIISVTAQAPTAATAARLSNGAVEVLKDHVGSIAATQNVPEARKLVVKQLGAARAATVTRGPRRLFGVVAAILIFALGCAMVLVVPHLARGWREIAVDGRASESGEPSDLEDLDFVDLHSEPRPGLAPELLASPRGATMRRSSSRS